MPKSLEKLHQRVAKQVLDLVETSKGSITRDDDSDNLWENYLGGFVETELESFGHKPETAAFDSAYAKVHARYLKSLQEALDRSLPKSANKAPKNQTATKALLKACAARKWAEVGALVAKNADIDAVDKDGRTPLHLACLDGDDKAVKELIRLGAQVNMAGKYGTAALHYASGSLFITKLLVEAGADPNALRENGNSVLADAVRSADIRRYLVAHGARVKGDDSASYEAGLSGDSKALDFIVSKGGSVDQGLLGAVVGESLEAVRWALANGADVDAKYPTGETVLTQAAKSGELALVAALIKSGANVNKKDDEGNTPLHVAAFHGNTKTVRALLAAGASKKAKDRDGKTPAKVADSEEVRAVLR